MPTRRLFLKTGLLMGCPVAAHPLLSTATLAATPGENRLVVIILRGAMDGLDAFQPRGDRNLPGLRRTLSLGPDHGATDLDDFFALHPGLADLLPLWRAGQMGFAPAARWTPRANMDLGPQEQLRLKRIHHDDPAFREASAQMLRIVAGLPDELRGDDPVEEHLELARFAANRLSGQTRIASFSMAGWDTHAGQAGRMRRVLGRLAQTILTLCDDLGPNWDAPPSSPWVNPGAPRMKTARPGPITAPEARCWSQAAPCAAAALWASGPDWGRGDLHDGRDLMPMRDIRAYAAWAMHEKFGIPRTTLEGAIFPGFDMGPDPKLLT